MEPMHGQYNDLYISNTTKDAVNKEKFCHEEVFTERADQTPTKYRLARIHDTWHCLHQHHIDNIPSIKAISPATIEQRLSEDGSGLSWTISAPITFTYRVAETLSILDPNNDMLLFGHITCPRERKLQKSKHQRRLVIIDDTVEALYGDHIRYYMEANNVDYCIAAFETTEETKNMEQVLKMAETINSFGLQRRSEPVIAIGGGVCLDMCGLASTLYRRRTPYIRIPTTLLSLVDASVGAKTGTNFCSTKNKLGAYVPPVGVYLDRTFLTTVPARHMSNGLAEILKMALMKHKELFDLLEEHGEMLIETRFQDNSPTLDDEMGRHGNVASRVVRLAIETMLEELAPNLWEDELDRLVDFGHLLSPTLEMTVLPLLLHGEAVNIDMAFMCTVSHVMGHLTLEQLLRILGCMKSLGLPTYHPACTLELVTEALSSRLKHSGGMLRMPLPLGNGIASIFNNVEDDIIRTAHDRWQQLCGHQAVEAENESFESDRLSVSSGRTSTTDDISADSVSDDTEDK